MEAVNWHQTNKEYLAAYKRKYYATHEQYKLKKRQQALARYYKLKEQKQNQLVKV